MLSNEKNCIPHKIEKTVRLKIGDASADICSGCSIMEVSFPANISCKLGFIKFKNNYVASLSVRLKYKNEVGFVWKTVLKNVTLMPSAHHELCSQDNVIIDAEKQFTDQPENVVAVRLILRQPSPHWSSFGVENLNFYLPPQDPKENKAEIEERPESEPKEEHTRPLDDLPSETVNTTSKIVNKFNQIASLATDKRVISSLKKSGSARFDVDGSYDLNLLSYT